MNATERLLDLVAFFCRQHSLFAEAWAEEIDCLGDEKNPSLYEVFTQFGGIINREIECFADTQLQEISREIEDALLYPHRKVSEVLTLTLLESVYAYCRRSGGVHRYVDHMGPVALSIFKDFDPQWRR